MKGREGRGRYATVEMEVGGRWGVLREIGGGWGRLGEVRKGENGGPGRRGEGGVKMWSLLAWARFSVVSSQPSPPLLVLLHLFWNAVLASLACLPLEALPSPSSRSSLRAPPLSPCPCLLPPKALSFSSRLSQRGFWRDKVEENGDKDAHSSLQRYHGCGCEGGTEGGG